MKTLQSKELKITGAFFLLGGLVGFFMFIVLTLQAKGFESLFFLIPAFFFAITFYAGYLILLKEDEKGLEIGRAILALQIIQFHIMGIGYSFVTGAFIFVGFTNWNFGFNFGLNTSFIINLTEETSHLAFNVNVLALGLFIYFSRLMKKIEEEKEFLELMEKEKEKRLEHK